MKLIEFHPEATAELIEAIEYCEQCAPGLGIDFRKEVEIADKILIVAVARGKRRPGYWHGRI